jgi:dipeptidyl aminopeptidase/acylaminoacyl peptidase
MYRRALRGTILVAVLAAASLIPSSASASFSGKNSKIILSGDTGISSSPRTLGIQAINPDGTGLAEIRADGSSEQPAVSPDGEKVAFVGSAPDLQSNDEIYLMNADGTGVMRVTRSPAGTDVFQPAWSPDGVRITFATNRDNPTVNYVRNRSIWIVNADATGLTRLTDGSTRDDAPAWSPDGSKIAFTRFAPGPGIWIMNADGTGQLKLTDGFAPNWSPDGQRIAYIGDLKGTNQVATINADGTGQALLTQGSDKDLPVWSPDGTMIAYTTQSRTEGRLWVMNADGTGSTKIATEQGISGLDWQPMPAFTAPGPSPFPLSSPDSNQAPGAKPTHAPRRSAYKSAAWFCKAKRRFMGKNAFGRRYGQHALRKCVAANRLRRKKHYHPHQNQLLTRCSWLRQAAVTSLPVCRPGAASRQPVMRER